MTHTERDEAAQTWAETPQWSRRDEAEARGYDGHPDDLLSRGLNDDDPWRPALEAAVAEVRQIGKEA